MRPKVSGIRHDRDETGNVLPFVGSQALAGSPHVRERERFAGGNLCTHFVEVDVGVIICLFEGGLMTGACSMEQDIVSKDTRNGFMLLTYENSPRSHEKGYPHHAKRAALWYACWETVRLSKATSNRVSDF